PIEHGGRTPVRLGDVATVEENHQPLIGDAIVGGRNGLLLVVQKLPGASTLGVTHELEATLDSLRPGLPGVRIDTHIFRPASYIETGIRNLRTAFAIGAALLVTLLAVLLGSWRALLVSVVAIILSLAAAALVLTLIGVTINALLVLGLVVALAIVV